MGSQAFTLGLRERCGPWICLWSGRGDSGIRGERRGAGDLAPTLCLTLQPRGSGFKAGSPGSRPGQRQGGWVSPGMGEFWDAPRKGKGAFRRGPRSLAGRLHGQEWAGSAEGAETDGKRLFGAPAPGEAATWGAGVRGPAPTAAPASWGLRAGTPYRHPEAHLEDSSSQRRPLQPLAPRSPRRNLGPRLSRTSS